MSFKFVPLFRAAALVSAVALIPAATAGLAAVDARSGPEFSKLMAVYERIKTSYVEPVDDDKLIKGAINGMLAALDPHSSYLDARDFENLRTQTDGSYGGLGLSVTMDDGAVKVIAPTKGSPADAAGVKAGDYITHINDEAIVGLTLVALRFDYNHQYELQYTSLDTVAELQARLVAHGFEDRLVQARFISSSANMARLYSRWRDQGDRAAHDELLDRITKLGALFEADSSLLLDERADAVLGQSKGERPSELQRAAGNKMQEVMRLWEIYEESAHQFARLKRAGRPYLDPKAPRLLESVLAEFGVRGQVDQIRPGPVVTLYELVPAPGVKHATTQDYLLAILTAPKR